MRFRWTLVLAMTALLLAGPAVQASHAWTLAQDEGTAAAPGEIVVDGQRYLVDQQVPIDPAQLVERTDDAGNTILVKPDGGPLGAVYVAGDDGAVTRYLPEYLNAPDNACPSEATNTDTIQGAGATYIPANVEPDLTTEEMEQVGETDDGRTIFARSDAQPFEELYLLEEDGTLVRYVMLDETGVPATLDDQLSFAGQEFERVTGVEVNPADLVKVGCAGAFPVLASSGETSPPFSMIHVQVADQLVSYQATEAPETPEPAIPATPPTEPATPIPTEVPPTQAPTEPPPTLAPTETPEPTVEPTAVPTEVPPTQVPTEPPPTETPAPTVTPTAVPTETPEPTAVPTEIPVPTVEPTEEPAPTTVPTEQPATETPAPTEPPATEAPEPTPAPTQTPEPTVAPTEPAATQTPMDVAATETPSATQTQVSRPTPTPEVLQPRAVVPTLPPDAPLPAAATSAVAGCTGNAGPIGADGLPERLPTTLQFGGTGYHFVETVPISEIAGLTSLGCVGPFEAFQSTEANGDRPLFLTLTNVADTAYRYEATTSFSVNVEVSADPRLLTLQGTGDQPDTRYVAAEPLVRSAYSSVSLILFVPDAEAAQPDRVLGYAVEGEAIGEYLPEGSAEQAPDEVLAEAEALGIHPILTLGAEGEGYVLVALWEPFGTTTNGWLTLYAPQGEATPEQLAGMDPRRVDMLIFNRQD